MASEKNITANRRNARQSTGPRTLEGKARVAQNALKHGLRAENITLPDEDPAAFEIYRKQIHSELEPQTAVEWSLVEAIASKFWRLLRVPRIEAAALGEQPFWSRPSGDESSPFDGFTNESTGRGLSLLLRYEESLQSGARRLLDQLRGEQLRRSSAELVKGLSS
jgi:hypothetical protein